MPKAKCKGKAKAAPKVEEEPPDAEEPEEEEPEEEEPKEEEPKEEEPKEEPAPKKRKLQARFLENFPVD